MSRKSKRIFSRSKGLPFLLLLLAAGPTRAAGQTVVVSRMPHWNLAWPRTPQQVAAANRMPLTAMLRLLRSSASGPGAVPMNLYAFRFAYLEPDRVYLVVSLGTRYGWLGTLSPVGGGKFQSTSIYATPNGSLATSLVDLRGDGVDEIIGRSLVDYRGAFTDPIYWYTIYAFHNGKPEDVGAEFPWFYQDNVLPRLDYLHRVFDWMRITVPAKLLQNPVSGLGPGSPAIELAEIGFVRLKYEHVILGHRNAGLARALQYAKSPNSDIAVLGVRLLAQMTAPEAWEEIHKLWNSPDFAVCSQARGAWLQKHGIPYTIKYQCPLPGARPKR